ncbi:RNA polymerase sigma factor [Ginsengibacter hankyongi]|uniref:RNA polymerase sigma factor n=1 Tax=Ginsengibacter hankyongi TaxID=2607284 RepID=UPI001927C719|nr:RNA polymerase sigma-70 factor [Ginsengibacter hankyongi]
MLNKNSFTEKDLLLLASKGCEDSFTNLFHLYKDRLYTFVLRLTNSEEQTLDLIQDIFMKLWMNRSVLATVDNLGSYIFRSARNNIINSFKRAMNEASILSELQAPNNLHKDVEINFEYKILESKFKNVVKKLPPQQRLVYTLSRDQGLKHEEIAQQLHISTSTVKNHMVEALKNIRMFLKNELDIAEFY